jgi:hypothetical protein
VKGLALALLLPALLAAPSLGCGSSGVQISHDELERLPRDSRQDIFDAENDLVIAHNRQDDAADRREKLEREEDEVEQTWKRASTRLNASGQGGKVSQARKIFDSRRAYLDSEIDVAKASMATTEAGTDLARARLQLVKARQLARIGRATVASLKPLEDNVASLDARVKAAASAEGGLRSKAQTQLAGWKAADDSYARATGDYDTGVWSD